MSRSKSGKVEEKLLHKRYLALGFHDDTTQETASQELVQSGLSQIPRKSAQRRKPVAPDQNSEFAASFLRAFGQRLWPSKVAWRGHLSEPRIPTRRIPARGKPTLLRFPIYSMDSRYTGTNRRNQEKKMRRELDEEEKIVRSPIGRLFKLYTDVVARVDFFTGSADADADALMDVILDTRGRMGDDEGGE